MGITHPSIDADIWRTLIRSVRPHRHCGIRCRVALWCGAIEDALAQVARVAPDDYRWLRARLTSFCPMPRARAQALAPTERRTACGAFIVPPAQRAYRMRHGRALLRPVSGRVELNVERCPVDVQEQRCIVAHELGHCRDILGRLDAERPGEQSEEADERAANDYVRRWGFTWPGTAASVRGKP